MIINNKRYNKFMGGYGTILFVISFVIGSFNQFGAVICALICMLWFCSMLFNTKDWLEGSRLLTNN